MPDASTLSAAIDAIDYSRLRVLPEYIDLNGHLNVGYYAVLFDRALDLPWEALGLGRALIDSQQKSTFSIETHMTYQREILLGDPLRFTFRLLDYDHKRLHVFMTMEHAREGYVAATFEQMTICVDMRVRKSTTWPAEIFARFAELHAAHCQRPAPPEVGRVIGIRR